MLLRCSGLRVGHRGRAVLPAIDLEIRQAQLWAVIGRNGSGKTTWLRTALGLLPPVAGRVEHARPDLRFSYVPQKSGVDDLYPLRARDVVRMGTDRGASFLRPLFGREPASITRALAEMGVGDLADRPFRSLSEGQKQRVLFARLSVSDAELAVLDEPTSAMDVVAEREALRLLDGLRRTQKMAIVIVSHFLGLAPEFADRAVLLDGATPAVVVGTPDEVLAHPAFKASYGDAHAGR